jgi:hypothetical protein
MKKLCQLGAFAVCLLFSSTMQLFAEEWTTKQQEVWKMEIAFWDSLRAGNLNRHMELWHEQATAWPASELTPVGKAEIGTATGSWCKFIESYELKPLAIGIYGSAALTFYQYEWTSKVGAPADLRNKIGRMGHFWGKQSGKWQILGGYSGGSSPYEETEETPVVVKEWSRAQQEILEVETAFWEFFKSDNIDGATELLHKDWLYWPFYKWEPIGRQQTAPTGWYESVKSYDLKPQMISIFEDYAMIYLRYYSDYLTGRKGAFLMKQDGKWRFVGGYTGGGSTSW